MNIQKQKNKNKLQRLLQSVKSELQIKLKFIEENKEIAAFQAEAEAAESSLSSNGSIVRFRHLPKADPKVLTEEFVTSKAQLNQTQTLLNPTVPDFVSQQ